MTMQDTVTPVEAPPRAKPGPKPRDLETTARLDEQLLRIQELERRQSEVIDVLAGLSQAGRWLKAQFLKGARA